MFMCARSINENFSTDLWEEDLSVQELYRERRLIFHLVYLFTIFFFKKHVYVIALKSTK